MADYDLHEEEPFVIRNISAHFKGPSWKTATEWTRIGLKIKQGDKKGEMVLLEKCYLGSSLATSIPALKRFFRRIAGEDI